MNLKINSALIALSFLAGGWANAIMINGDGTWSGPPTQTIPWSGKVIDFKVTATDNNASIWISLDNKSRDCNQAGPIGILRMGSHLGTGTAAEKNYANIQTILLTSKLTGQSVTIEQDNNCSITSIKVD